MTSERIETYDVVVVGGGAAGLSGALALARARRSVLVVDAGAPRNAAAGHVHNYLGREGTPPRLLLATGRDELEGYGGEVTTGEVTSAEAVGTAGEAQNGFLVHIDDGREVHARRLLVATGLTDELPDVPGLAQRWGRDVLHCPYCHGWEVRDQAIGVLATGPMALHQALLFRQLSEDVVLFQHTAPGPTDVDAEQLAARGIQVVSGEVAGLEVRDDRLTGVRLVSGEVISRQALVVAPRFTARVGVLATLGLEAEEQEMGGHVFGSALAADANGATAVPGVWVAGNVTDLRAQVVGSAAAGLNAGAAINADLVAEDTRRAVEAHRGRHRPDPGTSLEEFWETHYRRHVGLGTGQANPVLVEVTEPLEPRSALDLGAGEGSDAMWLAERGWQVTAVDVSATVLQRAAARAAAAGAGDRIDWQRHDLTRSFPEGSFDLVSAHYLHSPDDMMGTEVLRAGARAVAQGGMLMVVAHAAAPPWAFESAGHAHFPTPAEVLEALDLPPAQWRTDRAEVRSRQGVGPDGRTGTLTDSVVVLTRLAA